MMLPPGMPMILLAIGLLALRGSRWERVRRVATVLAPLLSLAHLAILVPEDAFCRVRWLDLELTIVRADRLAMIWGWLFHVAAILAAIYSLYDRSSLDAAFGLIYAGSAIAAVFAGDLLTLFLFWELTALASAYLVWAGQQRGSPDAGTRYLIVQVGSGVLLLAGTLGLAYGGSEVGITFGGPSEIGVFRDQLNQWPVQLIFGAFCVKAAFPIVHTWLPDAYPKSSPVGAVFLSAFTTKMAIYMLVRGFAGWPPLIAVGCAMAIAPLVYAVVEDDLRRCLAYCLVNQLGFMVVAIGVGTPLAINGVAGHAISHVLYKGLLFMVAGAILHRTGTARLSKLGGLATQMPFTFAAYLFAVAAISMPMFSGFVTKSLSVAAVGEAHLQSAWLCLLAANDGRFLDLRSANRVFCVLAAGATGILSRGIFRFESVRSTVTNLPADAAMHEGRNGIGGNCRPNSGAVSGLDLWSASVFGGLRTLHGSACVVSVAIDGCGSRGVCRAASAPRDAGGRISS